MALCRRGCFSVRTVTTHAGTQTKSENPKRKTQNAKPKTRINVLN
jgi:hypothetical protein